MFTARYELNLNLLRRIFWVFKSLKGPNCLFSKSVIIYSKARWIRLGLTEGLCVWYGVWSVFVVGNVGESSELMEWRKNTSAGIGRPKEYWEIREIERGSTRAHSVGELALEEAMDCRKTENRINECKQYVLGHNQPPVKWVPILFLGLKRPRLGLVHP